MIKIGNQGNPFATGNSSGLTDMLSKLMDSGLEKKPFSWPKIIPKNYKFKGKNYIHYAAEKKDMSMLDKAITDKHDLSLIDNFGKNAIYYFFQEEKSMYNNSSKLIDPSFFIKIVTFNKKSWNSSNTYDFFNYFKKQLNFIIHYETEVTYDEEKYKKIISVYRELLHFIKASNLKFNMDYETFHDLIFNSTNQSEIIGDALMISKEKEKCLKRLITTINLFSTPIPKKFEPIKETPFLVFMDEFGYYANHQMIIGTSGMGKTFFIAEKLNREFIIDSNANQDMLYQIFEKNILKNDELKNYFNDDLLTLLNQYNHLIGSKVMKFKLDAQLSKTQKAPTKKIKI